MVTVDLAVDGYPDDEQLATFDAALPSDAEAVWGVADGGISVTLTGRCDAPSTTPAHRRARCLTYAVRMVDDAVDAAGLRCEIRRASAEVYGDGRPNRW